MSLMKAVVLSGLAIVMMAATQIVLAEETVVEAVDSEVITSNQLTPSQKESDLQWAWGEVTNLDNQAKTITLKYLDYETDQEKELILVVDEKTTFENVKDFSELKIKDTLSIDYMIGVDSKNIATNVSFEQPEVASSTLDIENSEPGVLSVSGPNVVDAPQPAAPQEASAPDLAQPTTQSAVPIEAPVVETPVAANVSTPAVSAGSAESVLTPTPAPAEPVSVPAVQN